MKSNSLIEFVCQFLNRLRLPEARNRSATIESSIIPLTMTPTETQIKSVREQIQEDILSFASVIDDEKIFLTDEILDEICGIVIDNFNTLLK